MCISSGQRSQTMSLLNTNYMHIDENHCDDPSGVLIPSTTRYSHLYRVEPSYTEQVIQSRIFLLFRVGYAEQTISVIPSRLYDGVEYFCYSEQVMRSRLFLHFRVGSMEQNIFAIPSRLNRVDYFCYSEQTISEQTISEQTISEQTFSEQTSSD